MKGTLIILGVLLLITNTLSKKVDRTDPVEQKVNDKPEIVRLEEQEKFLIPLNGRTISYHAEFYPANNGECKFIDPKIKYSQIR